MTQMFENCYSIEYLNLKNFKTNQLKFMYGMFQASTGLKEIDLSGF